MSKFAPPVKNVRQMPPGFGGNCPECGKSYALVGRVHRCEPVKSSVKVADEPTGLSGVTEPTSTPIVPSVERKRSSFDRTAYQREYLRKYMKTYLPKWRKRKRDALRTDR
jgi:hypothetical protein